MVLKHFILPEEHFKANMFFPIMTPPNPPKNMSTFTCPKIDNNKSNDLVYPHKDITKALNYWGEFIWQIFKIDKSKPIISRLRAPWTYRQKI